MVGGDLAYIRRLIADNVISGPVLELGVGYGGVTSRSVIEAAGLRYYGTDMSHGEGVDYQADFERPEEMAVFQPIVPVGSVLILNVLEHTFDPIRVLDNAATLVRTGGSLVVSTPAVWPLHNYPMDAWRILPNFYEEYAKRRGWRLLERYFDYVGFGPVKDFRNPDATYSFPPPGKPGLRYGLSRAIHKTFNTFGRSMFQPSHIAVGATFLVERAS
jgi:SAM-dependent methyltransferase